MKTLRKVLIITYYWPPSGGGGVQRLVKFSKTLPKFGWQPVVLTVKKGDWPAYDLSLQKKVPKECKIYKTEIFEPYGFYRKFVGRKRDEKLPVYILSKKNNENLKEKFARWLRLNLFIPDPRIGWYYYGIKKGMRIIKKENINLIFSSGPPQTVHLIAKKLSIISGLKWIADFRDPWTDAFWLTFVNRNFITQKLDLRLEKSVLRQADAITTISAGLINLFAKKVNNKYFVIYNGFDEIYNKKIQTDKFTILFIGSLGSYHNVDLFFKILNSINNDIKTQMEIVFAGRVFDDFSDFTRKYSDLKIIYKKYLPYNELMDFSQRASLLFNPYFVNSGYVMGSIGTKFFDYLALQRPILALGQKNSDADIILQETESGKLFEFTEFNKILQFVVDNYNIWFKNKYNILKNDEKLHQYSTTYNVKKLVEIFENSLGINTIQK